jgi:DNA-binding NtrC family response regulator
MRDLRAHIALAAPSGHTVLIDGERGTGKELVARALHELWRPKAPFVAFNCGGIAPTLADSQLFGHNRGAFTGATAPHPGVFERAGNGTLFLDEIADLPLDVQRKLLRVLESGDYTRLGEIQSRQFEGRIVTATNRDLDVMARRREFLPDLLDRLRVIVLRIPPLRERLDDIPSLVHSLAVRYVPAFPSKIHDDAWALLRAQPWPGNVRDLRNVVQRISTLHGDAPLDAQTLRPLLDPRTEPTAGPTSEPPVDAHDVTLRTAVDAVLAMKGLPAYNVKLLLETIVLGCLSKRHSDRAIAEMTGVRRAKVRQIRSSFAGKRGP